MNNIKNRKKHGIFFRIVVLAGGLCAAVLTAFFIYASVYYRSQETALKLLEGSETVTVTKIEEGLFLDGYGETEAIIFYPGAKVEYTAYLPIFYEVAKQGVDVFLVDMPFRMAMFGMNKADRIRETYSYEHWYLSGHSLGGAMGAVYVSKHPDAYDGMIFLASYPTKELKREGFRVLSIYGSNDRVINYERFDESKQNMPADFSEICIEGGNHGQFGDYGFQSGDGEATVSKEEQWQLSADAILELVQEH